MSERVSGVGNQVTASSASEIIQKGLVSAGQSVLGRVGYDETARLHGLLTGGGICLRRSQCVHAIRLHGHRRLVPSGCHLRQQDMLLSAIWIDEYRFRRQEVQVMPI